MNESSEQLTSISKKSNIILTSQAYNTYQFSKVNNELKGMSSKIDAISGVLTYGLEDIREGMYGLKAAFEWGISNVVWQLEQNRAEYKRILEVLQSPLDTKAKELRKRGEEAYLNEWTEDALQDFLESEQINRYDFFVHISLGMIYLFYKKDDEKALEYFDKAMKYAKPKSNYYTSYALLHKAYIKQKMGLTQESESLSQEAINLCPDFSEAYYQNAQYNTILNNIPKSIANLTKAIELDKNYCLKSDSDPVFERIKNDLVSLYEKLRNMQVERGKYAIKKLELSIGDINKITNEIGKTSTVPIEELQPAKELLNKNTYFEALDARSKIFEFFKNLKAHMEDLHNYMKSEIEDLEAEIVFENDPHQKKKRSNKLNIAVAVLVSIVLYIILVITSLVITEINGLPLLFLPLVTFFIVKSILNSRNRQKVINKLQAQEKTLKENYKKLANIYSSLFGDNTSNQV